jgi:hypothetical protein
MEGACWLAPIAATVVAYAVSYYSPSLAQKAGERPALMIFFLVAFTAAAFVGMIGSKAV